MIQLNFKFTFIRKAICKIRGHRYPSPYFDNYTLSFCTCCGEEIANRTFDDIEPMPENYIYEDEHPRETEY